MPLPCTRVPQTVMQAQHTPYCTHPRQGTSAPRARPHPLHPRRPFTAPVPACPIFAPCSPTDNMIAEGIPRRFKLQQMPLPAGDTGTKLHVLSYEVAGGGGPAGGAAAAAGQPAAAREITKAREDTGRGSGAVGARLSFSTAQCVGERSTPCGPPRTANTQVTCYRFYWSLPGVEGAVAQRMDMLPMVKDEQVGAGGGQGRGWGRGLGCGEGEGNASIRA